MAAPPDIDELIGRIPASCTVTTPNLKCCCGRSDCVYLVHNCDALDDLERELQTAAQLGQVRISHVISLVFLRGESGTYLQSGRDTGKEVFSPVR